MFQSCPASDIPTTVEPGPFPEARWQGQRAVRLLGLLQVMALDRYPRVQESVQNGNKQRRTLENYP